MKYWKKAMLALVVLALILGAGTQVAQASDSVGSHDRDGVPNGMVSVGGALVVPASDWKGYSIAFEPSLRALYYFPGSSVQIGLGIELGYQTPTSRDFLLFVGNLLIPFKDKWSAFNALALVRVRVPLNKKRRVFWWIGPALGVSRLKDTVEILGTSVSDSVTRFAIAGRTGFAWHFGPRGNVSIQPEFGIMYTKVFGANYLRIQPGIQIGFHF